MASVICRHLRIVRRWWVNCEARNQRLKDLRTNGWLSIGLDPADHKSILITFLIFSFCFFNDGHGGKSLNCKEWSSAGHVYIFKETANYTYVKRTSIIVTDCWIAPAARGSLLLPTVVFVVWHCGWARQFSGVSWDMETKSLPLWSSQAWLHQIFGPGVWPQYNWFTSICKINVSIPRSINESTTAVKNNHAIIEVLLKVTIWNVNFVSTR